MHALAETLRKNRLFASLSPEALTSAAEHAVRRDVAAGEAVFHEGEPGEGLVLVVEGRLRTTKRGEGGREITLSHLIASDVAGLTSLLTQKPHSATVTAEVPSVVCTFSRKEIDQLRATNRALERAILAHLAEKVRARSDDLANARAPETGELRVAFFDSKDYVRDSFRPHAGESDLHFFDVRLDADTAPLARDARVVCAFVNDTLDASVLESLARGGTELVAMRCAGYNNVDVAAAERLGLSIVRVPAYSPYAIAEHAMALVLCLDRKLHIAHARVRDGNFSLHGLVGFDLHGRTGAVLGTGAIGKCLARIFRGFGMRVLLWDAWPDEGFAAEIGGTYVDLDAALRESDVFSLHVPLVKETTHLLGRESLARTKRGAMLVNTSRGGLVDTLALIEALKSGQIGAAGLDVYEEESAYFFEDHSANAIADDTLARLLTFPNVIVTSHQAFLTEEALESIARTTMDSIAEWYGGRRGAELTYAVTTGGG